MEEWHLSGVQRKGKQRQILPLGFQSSSGENVARFIGETGIIIMRILKSTGYKHCKKLAENLFGL